MISDMVIAETRKEIEHFCSLGARVIVSRAAVCSTASKFQCRKPISIFRPQTDLISAASLTPIEFGSTVSSTESGARH